MADEENWWDREFEDYHTSTQRAGDDAAPIHVSVTATEVPSGPKRDDSLTASSLTSQSPIATESGRKLDKKPSCADSLRSEDSETDDEERWIECTENDTGNPVWYNARTNELVKIPPAGYGGHRSSRLDRPSGAMGIDEVTDTVAREVTEEEMGGLSHEDLLAIRRNSLIMDGAWDESKDVDPVGAYHPGMTSVEESTSPAPRVRVRKQTSSEIERLLHTVRAGIEALLQLSLPSGIGERMRSMRDNFTELMHQVEAFSAEDNRDDVSALVFSDVQHWDFDNEEVRSFRARASRVPHQQFLCKDWSMPMYPSNAPFPREATAQGFTAVVLLGSEETKDAANYHKSTRVSVTADDTVARVVQQAHAKFTSQARKTGVELTLGPATDYVLKARGLNEYMAGDHLIFDFQYVRQCLRDNSTMELVVVRRPEPRKPHEDSEELAKLYKKVAEEVKDVKVLTVNDYVNFSLSPDTSWITISFIPMSELTVPFRVRICGLDRCAPAGLPRLDGSVTHLYFRTFLFHGAEVLANSARKSKSVPPSNSPRWMEWLQPASHDQDVYVSGLPRATRLALCLFGSMYGNKAADRERDRERETQPSTGREMLGWVVVQLVDSQGRLLSGMRELRLWGMSVKAKEGDLSFLFRATTRDNRADPDAAILTVQFDEYQVPVVAPVTEQLRQPNVNVVGAEIPYKQIDKAHIKEVQRLMNQDSLYVLQPPDKKLLWTYRHQLVKRWHTLPKFLESIDYTNPDHRQECYRMLATWQPPPDPTGALELLDYRFADYRVREYGVSQLRRFSDEELQLYLLQLVQCLKYEPYHDSPLCRFLIQRALSSPLQVGHYLFWHLKAEVTCPDFTERFALILEEYLAHCGDYSKTLRKQNAAVLKLQRIAELIVKLKTELKYSDEQCMKEYMMELEKFNRDFLGTIEGGTFQLPLNPKLEARRLLVDNCRYMSSKKVPLWLVLENADDTAPPIYVIFKSGDDLRQDILTLQLLKVMDKIWLDDNLDLRLTPYRVCATGEGLGFIEVVTNSDTTSGIQLKYGGGAAGALLLDPLDKYLKDHNKGDQYDRAVQNFIRSCAGYCVATYVMGIGDRHNGNIMVTKDGHLFHIDFGHFLGNFKKKFGFNRERAPFVFTPEMAFVMGGRKYKASALFKTFRDLCCQAFNSLRKHAVLLENMFTLMLPAGMPELGEKEDVQYLKEKLELELSDKDAEKVFRKEIRKSLDTTWRRIDNWIHNIKHG